MNAKHELFDHTADVGVRIHAHTMEEIPPAATAGLYEILGHLARTGAPEDWSYEITGDEAAFLLRDYLAEVLHLFESDHRALTNIQTHDFSDSHIAITAKSWAVDTHQSELNMEIKAITYHELAVQKTSDGYQATYIVDI